MFIPLFIAMLLGFVSTSTTTSSSGTTTAIIATNSTSANPDDQPPGDDTGWEQGHILQDKIISNLILKMKTNSDL